MLGEGVEEGVGGGVVALAGRAEDAGGRGEQHERRQTEVAGEVVEVEGGVGLGPQDGVEAFGREGVDDAVVEDTGGVDDGGQRVGRGDGGEGGGERLPVGGVAGRPGHLGAERVQLAGQLGRAGCGLAATAEQQQVAYAALGDEVPCDEPAEGAGGAGDEDGAFGGRTRAARPGLRRRRGSWPAGVRGRRRRAGRAAAPARRGRR
ncbi:hypothetical protein GCM10020254_75180 [Streptomyces goshikiensis]